MASTVPFGPDPTLYLYTSLTAGSSHIITATSRLETILKANKIAFRAIDCATDEKARQLWSRRSKTRKLPGLVKYGQVIGDLKEVEEWNEYGEIKENLDNVSDIFGDTPMTDTPMPPPSPITLKDPLAKPSDPPSRSSSEARHISISDPKDKDKSGSPASSVRNLKDDTPMSMAMRQAGMEAAAKAGQKKASATSVPSSDSSTNSLPGKRDSTDTTPSVTATKMSVDAEEVAEATEITAAKTPAQLATEGAKRTSVDKIAEQSPTESSSPLAAEPESMSNEEQLLEARRSSTMAKVPSRLAQGTSISELSSPASEEAITSQTNLADTTANKFEPRPKHHRGSSLSDASKEEIAEAERKIAIPEESEETSEEETNKIVTAKTSTKPGVGATDEVEAQVTKKNNPQEQKAKDADAAGVSAAAAMFLSPNHDPNPNRLSADSASVYSFFDSAFSPAPLFSGSQELDLGLDFVKGFGRSDPRTSISTYGTNDDLDHLTNGSNDDRTPRQSHDVRRAQSVHENENSPRKDILPIIPVIAPLRTPTRRQVSAPLLSTSNRESTPSSIPLPLNIRKSPTNPTTSPQPHLEPYSPPIPPIPISPSASPSSATASPTITESRSLRFKKSIRSLRSKKSTQGLNAVSPAKELPPNLPPQRHLKSQGVGLGMGMGNRSVSDGVAVVGVRAEEKRKAGGGARNLLCF